MSILKNTTYIGEYFSTNNYYQIIKTLDGKEFIPRKILGKGTNGSVILYETDADNKNKIAVKYGRIEEDIDIIEYIKRKDACSELVVNHVILDKKCIIMENAYGTINELIPQIKLNKRILIDILYAIIIAIDCLWDIHLAYIDIKMINILYRYTDKGIQIILGDLGGIMNMTTARTFTFPTYPPYEWVTYKEIREDTEPFEQRNEKNIAWGLACWY